LKKVKGLILDVEGAACLLGVSKHTIYRLVNKDKLPATRVGKEWRFHRPTLIQWVATGSNLSQLEQIFKSSHVKIQKK
jgi:excisionase family DNA binding protein